MTWLLCSGLAPLSWQIGSNKAGTTASCGCAFRKSEPLAPQLRQLIESHGGTNLAVFGSDTRNEAGPSSDVDLLVDLPEHASLLDRADLQQAIQELLQQKIDLIRRRSLKAELRATVEGEAVAL